MFRNPNIYNCILFENHLKSVILQNCERSALNLWKMCQIVDIQTILVPFLTNLSSPCILALRSHNMQNWFLSCLQSFFQAFVCVAKIAKMQKRAKGAFKEIRRDLKALKKKQQTPLQTFQRTWRAIFNRTKKSILLHCLDTLVPKSFSHAKWHKFKKI